MIRQSAILSAMFALLAFAHPVQAINPLHLVLRGRCDRVNADITGQILDYTDNHSHDRRIYSPALGHKRSLYVYLPPGYDGTKQFPVMIWLHGFGQTETSFLDFVPVLDLGIRTGKFPPMIIAAPDGRVEAKLALFRTGSFYLNSKAGNYQDFIARDLWSFLVGNFHIRPEREAHVIAGASMGGFGAYQIGFDYRQTFGVLAGLMPPLDVRYADCNDKYFSDYNPNCVMYRDHIRRQRVIASFYHGLIVVRERRLTDPLLGRNAPDGLKPLAAHNPIEMLGTLQIQPNEFAMFIGYSGKDEFNLNAQAEHFLDVAGRRGIHPAAYYLPEGHHDSKSGKAMVPPFAHWLYQQLAAYVPPGYPAPTPGNGPAANLLTKPGFNIIRRPNSLGAGSTYQPELPRR